MDDVVAFARLVEALRPWLGHLVIVGGWAHHVHRYHPDASAPPHAPLRTRDMDLAFSTSSPLRGDIKAALEAAGFVEELMGEHTPPVTHYQRRPFSTTSRRGSSCRYSSSLATLPAPVL